MFKTTWLFFIFVIISGCVTTKPLDNIKDGVSEFRKLVHDRDYSTAQKKYFMWNQPNEADEHINSMKSVREQYGEITKSEPVQYSREIKLKSKGSLKYVFKGRFTSENKTWEEEFFVLILPSGKPLIHLYTINPVIDNLWRAEALHSSKNAVIELRKLIHNRDYSTAQKKYFMWNQPNEADEHINRMKSVREQYGKITKSEPVRYSREIKLITKGYLKYVFNGRFESKNKTWEEEFFVTILPSGKPSIHLYTANPIVDNSPSY